MERDWLLVFGHPREEILTLRLWLWFVALLLAVLVIGSALGY
jgi:hypothetical protein